MPVVWPTTLLVPANVKLTLENSSRSGGVGITGAEQIVVSPAARWTMSFSGLAVRTTAQIRALRAIEAQLDGRAGTLVLPIYDRGRARGGAGDAAGSYADLTWDDGTSFDDDTLWTQPVDVEDVRVVTDAALNATSLDLTWAGPAPLPGQHFSIDSRLYRVRTVMATGPDAGTITFRPWLRAAVPAGTFVDFADPVGQFRLAKDDGLALDLQLWRFASLSIDFTEA